jgi:hypothetical protein
MSDEKLVNDLRRVAVLLDEATASDRPRTGPSPSPAGAPPGRRRLVAAALAVLVVMGVVGVAVAVLGGSDDPGLDVAVAPTTVEGIAEFCAAVAALDQTDGTTEDSVALAAFEAVRRTAPAEIRADVDLVVDTIIVNDFPSGVQPSMEAAPYEEHAPASARLGAYVEANCELAG